MLDIIYGPMFSGKTSKLQRLIDRYLHQGFKCRFVKHMGDIRYSSDKVSSHPKKVFDGAYEQSDAVSASRLQDVLDELMEYDVIAIDEGQFFDDLHDTVIHLLKNNKIVLIAALDGTFEQKPFSQEQVSRLIPYAQRVEKRTAVCNSCKSLDACATIRLGNNREEVAIGGIDKYEARCLKCLFKQ